MTKEEQKLINKFGTENHFSVPEGYFDTFADQLMQQLPEQQARVVKISWWYHLPLRKIAAVIGVAVCMATGTLYIMQHTSHAATEQVAHAESSENIEHSSNSAYYGTFDEVVDYTMTDNQDIYASLLAEN